jgi:hypothetical protein
VFTNITPLFIISVLGVILCIGETMVLLFSKDNGEFATGILCVLALVLYGIILIDRNLVKRIKLKRLILFELVFILFLPLPFMYFNKTTKIRVETAQEYFIVIYNDNGIRKEQIPSSGFFNRSLTIKNQNIINLHSTLHHDKEVIIATPKSWNDGDGSIYFDTIINFKKESYQIIYHNIKREEADSILKKSFIEG